MKLTCDQCGVEYEGGVDSHEYGEPNWCCRACAWENSHGGDEPKPSHCCQDRPAIPTKACPVHFGQDYGWWRRLDVPHDWTCRRCHPPHPELYDVEYAETAT